MLKKIIVAGVVAISMFLGVQMLDYNTASAQDVWAAQANLNGEKCQLYIQTETISMRHREDFSVTIKWVYSSGTYDLLPTRIWWSRNDGAWKYSRENWGTKTIKPGSYMDSVRKLTSQYL